MLLRKGDPRWHVKPAARSRLGYPSVLIGSLNAKLRAEWRAGLSGGYAVEEAPTREALERLLSTFAPDILLLDLDLPRIAGIGDIESLHAFNRETWIVVLSRSPNEWEGLSALKAGARGYCGKDIDTHMLRKVVDRVHEGEFWAGRRLIPRLIDEYASRPQERRQGTHARSDQRLELLTTREQQIASLVGSGASNKEIASRLNIGEGTVKAHLTSTFRKLGLADRLALGLFMQKA